MSVRLRLALVGAFAFPAPLGSQRFFAAQAEALEAAGVDVEHFTYAATGSTLRGIDPRKLAADRVLARALLAAQRTRRRFEAVLAHNAEAALLALSLRRRLGVPVVYVVHTLWAEELESWLPERLAPAARAGGRALDRALARHADGVLVLAEAARHALAPHARGPLACVAPGHAPEPAPAAEEVAEACARRGLAPEGFALYAGNLDHYQALDGLDAAARASGLPVVVVTHDARPARFGRLRVIRSDSVAEARLLLHGAAVALLPRRSAGGFPIKLLHSMEAGRAILARRSLAATLVHGESAWLLPDAAGAEDWAGALDTLAADAALRARLGSGARRALAKHHAWPERAGETLALVRETLSRSTAR